MSRKAINGAPGAPGAIGPYSQAVRAGQFLFASGQIGLDPGTGAMVEGDIKAQTKRVMENIKAVLASQGLDFSHVVKSLCFLTDLSEFPAFNEVYGTYFPKDPPARSTVGVAALPKGARVEVEVIAVFPS